MFRDKNKKINYVIEKWQEELESAFIDIVMWGAIIASIILYFVVQGSFLDMTLVRVISWFGVMLFFAYYRYKKFPLRYKRCIKIKSERCAKKIVRDNVIMLLIFGGFTFYFFSISFIYPELLFSHITMFLIGVFLVSIMLIITFLFSGLLRSRMFQRYDD